MLNLHIPTIIKSFKSNCPCKCFHGSSCIALLSKVHGLGWFYYHTSMHIGYISNSQVLPGSDRWNFHRPPSVLDYIIRCWLKNSFHHMDSEWNVFQPRKITNQNSFHISIKCQHDKMWIKQGKFQPDSQLI